ncbi:MAG: hypothetical protein ACI4HI_13150 [Lachnospiraceae bacterium]
MEKNKKIISITAVVLLAIVLVGGVGLYQAKEKNSKDCRFLQTYGSLNYVPNGENDCSLAFVTKGWTNDLADEELEFFVESEKINVTELQLSQTAKSGSYALWNLYFKYEVTDFNPGDEDLCVSDVTLNGKKLSIGNLFLHAVEKRGSTDEIISLGSSVASSGTECSDFFAQLQNQSESVCNVKKVEAPHFSKVLADIVEGEGAISQNPKILKKPVALEAGKIYTMTLSFQQAELPENAQLYYASPILTYEKDGKKQEMAFDAFRCGVDLTKEELKQYGKTLFE